MAQTNHTPDRRPHRRLPLGTALQRDHRSPARRLPLRPRDPGARTMGGHQAPVPAIRHACDGCADDGLHLPPRANGSGWPHDHRHVGRFEVKDPSPVVAAVSVGGDRHRKRDIRRGLRASSRREAVRSGDGRAQARAVQWHSEPTPAGWLVTRRDKHRTSLRALHQIVGRGWVAGGREATTTTDNPRKTTQQVERQIARRSGSSPGGSTVSG